MAGTTSAQPTGLPPSADVLGGSGRGAASTPSDGNSCRVSSVFDLLYRHIEGTRTGDTDFLNLCISLARSIDFGIAYNEVLSRYQELPTLIKQVCQKLNNVTRLAGAMVLMISVKNACQSGWFSNKDSEELNNLAKEIASSFACPSDLTTVPCDSNSVISTIMSRFYPRMRMGHTFAFLELKPGFDAYVTDFQLSRNLKPSPGDKIRLFVAQIDNIETSSCLVSPPKANFLLNGKGVVRRTNLYMDMGPQIPTVINNLLKYGPNLLQVVGDFSGNYIVAVAIMSQIPNPDSSALQDYEQLPTTAVDSDSEIIEGPSRISLNCPISHQRIKTPVKGRLCKHIQCFDFDNYVAINSNRPLWRCPCCNQDACFTDIGIDQRMAKVLQEAGPKTSDIIFSPDGSWNAVMGSDGTVEKPQVDTTNMGEDEPPQPPDVLDLTQTDDAMDAVDTCRTEDTKNVSQYQVMNQTTSINPPINAQGRPNSQHYQFGNPSASNAFERFGFMNPRRVTQSPPFAAGNSGNQQSPSSASNFIPSSLSAASQASPAAPNIPTAFPTRSPVAQQVHRNTVNTSIRNNFPVVLPAPPAAPSVPTTHGAQSSTPMLQLSLRDVMYAARNTPLAHPVNPRHASQVSLPSLHHQQQHSQQNLSQLQLIEAANRAAQMATGPSRAYPSFLRNDVGVSSQPGDLSGNIGVSSQPAATRTDMYDPNDMNWRPAARMRGALTGQAYAEALNQFIIQPSQQAQVVPTNVPAQVQALVSGRVAQGAATAPHQPPARPAFGSDPLADAHGMD